MIVRELAAQGDLNGPTMASALQYVLAGKNMDRLDVAVAYATRSGLIALRNAAGGFPEVSRWVIGLDDAITQPLAIDDVVALPNSIVRLASLSSEGRRFHPKIYCFWSSMNPVECICVIGSANMTLHGLNRNGETGVILVSENIEDADRLKASWASMWDLGEHYTEARLETYREFHAKARKAQRRMAKIGAILPQLEAEEGLNEDVQEGGAVAWVDFGSAMGNGRELEFPKAMMQYFDINENSVSPQDRLFYFAENSQLTIAIVRRENNGMWRIIFNNSVPEVEKLARKVVNGKKQRSDHAAYFQKTNAGFHVKFLQHNTDEYNDVVQKSEQSQSLYRTIPGPKGKNYGFL